MRLLVIGGGEFLGPGVVDAALAGGHDVTTMTRSGRGVPAGVESLLGDRETAEGLGVLGGREWDAVVDTCGYVPRVVSRSAAALVDAVGHYVFVSSISAYDGWPEAPIHGDTPVFDCPPDAGPEDGHYGELKAGCERAVLQHFADRATIARAGHIVGIGDNVGRLPWWITRVARGGKVLAPAPPERPLSMVDARDLGAWLVHCGLTRVAGAMPATGPPGQSSFGELLEAAKEATGSEATFVWVDEDFLVSQEVEPWQELPYWLPLQFCPGADDIDTNAAQAAGLTCRPVSETVRDTWAWLRDNGPPPQRPDRPAPGIDDNRERSVIFAWRAAGHEVTQGT
ncbi:MAG: NAD-dependent epimerase [Actinomycetota bacterium]|nr:NAD-dependent epimerase [Actinomycetota bacterium]